MSTGSQGIKAGRAYVEVGVNDKLGTGLQKAGAKLKHFAVNVARVAAGIGAAFTLLAGRQIRAALAEMSKIDEIAKTADRIGTMTEDLISLQHGAELAGVGNAELNKSLETLNRRLGTGEASKRLKQLGLSAEELSKVSTVEALAQIADKIRALPTPALKAAAAYDLFGRSGQKLLNLLESGGDTIRGFRIEAELLGIVFNRDQAAAVEAANDAWTRLQALGRGLHQTLAILLSPAVQALAQDLTTLGIVLRDVNQIEGPEFGKNQLGFFTRANLVRHKDSALLLRFLADSQKKLMDSVPFEPGANDKKLFEFLDTAADIAESRWRDAFDKSQEAAEKVRKLFEQATGIAPPDEPEAPEFDAKASPQFTSASARVAAINESVMADQERHAKNFADFTQLVAIGAITWETYTRAVRKSNEELAAALESAGEPAQRLQEQRKVTQDALHADVQRLRIEADKLLTDEEKRIKLLELEERAALDAAKAEDWLTKTLIREKFDLERALLDPTASITDRLQDVSRLVDTIGAFSPNASLLGFDQAEDKQQTAALRAIQRASERHLRIAERQRDFVFG